jgi:hypothetical protein
VIPITSREYVEHTDTDGIVFRFVPKSGELEQEMLDIYKGCAENDTMYSRISEFIDRILLLPKYDKVPSKVFNTQEKFLLLELWHKANKIAVEEKKS